jgi:DNA-binding winged helix-turn-helix (wHTH) protein
MSTETHCRVFRFGTFEASEADGELRRQGVRIKLHSQPFQMLIMLLERPSELVTREQMRQRLWGEDTFVDFDHGLNTSVNKLRQALRDSASEPRYVETIPGKGYRFIAPVGVETVQSKVAEETIAEAEKQTPVDRPIDDTPERLFGKLLAGRNELPSAPRKLVRSLLLLTEAMYLAFYVGALANLQEIHDIFVEANLRSPSTLISVLVAMAAAMIPVRLFLLAAIAFDLRDLPAKFRVLFPVLLLLDLVWAFSPFLLVHHVSTGLALGMSAALVYMPFAQRSLILMYTRR